jgi:hypothetical protein
MLSIEIGDPFTDSWYTAPNTELAKASCKRGLPLSLRVGNCNLSTGAGDL